jgi:transcriptional regulator with XRE-family HTH domain
MSAANLSRIENGDQGPPSDEVIEQLAIALEMTPEPLLAVIGRASSADAFEQRVLRELHRVREEMREGFNRIERALGGQ